MTTADIHIMDCHGIRDALHAGGIVARVTQGGQGTNFGPYYVVIKARLSPSFETFKRVRGIVHSVEPEALVAILHDDCGGEVEPEALQGSFRF